MKNLLISTFIVTLFLSGCGNSDGKVVVTKYDFFTKGDGKFSWELSARGSVQNVGKNAVKNVVISFTCEDCAKQGEDISGKWVPIQEGHPEGRDTISYLAAGSKEDFEFKIGLTVSDGRPSYAPNVQIKIASFEQAD